MLDSKASTQVGRRTITFYDLDCLINIPMDVAKGYIVILAGGIPKQSAVNSEGRVIKRPASKDPAGNIGLGFLALTEGNVIDRCFGLSTVTASRTSAGYKQVEKVKSSLIAAADENEDIRRLAVETFQGCFEILLQYRRRLMRLNWFSRCFRYRGQLVRLKFNLDRLFEELNDTLSACNH
jgi:hypothetical protein